MGELAGGGAGGLLGALGGGAGGGDAPLNVMSIFSSLFNTGAGKADMNNASFGSWDDQSATTPPPNTDAAGIGQGFQGITQGFEGLNTAPTPTGADGDPLTMLATMFAGMG